VGCFDKLNMTIGMTSNLERRVFEHKHQLIPGFTSTYNVSRLVYMEAFSDVHDAIRREKQLKGWSRRKKIALIENSNPTWRDLSVAWFVGDSSVTVE
jgi:putative endonuclease